MRDVEEWVSSLQAGEDDAWKEFIRVFARFVPIVANRLGLTAEEKEEVLQDTVLIAYRSIGNLRTPSGISSWVYTIARRTAINHWRAKRRLPAMEGEDGANPDRFAAEDVPIDEIMESWEDGRQLREAVGMLKPACRSLVEDLFLSEPRLSYKEVSEKRKMPIGSIGPTLARCLEALRRSWKSVSRGT